MPKEKPLQGKPIRGSGENSMIAEIGYKSNIPLAAINSLERELTGLAHGTVSLSVYVRDGRITRFTTNRECSTVISSNTGETAEH